MLWRELDGGEQILTSPCLKRLRLASFELLHQHILGGFGEQQANIVYIIEGLLIVVTPPPLPLPSSLPWLWQEIVFFPAPFTHRHCWHSHLLPGNLSFVSRFAGQWRPNSVAVWGSERQRGVFGEFLHQLTESVEKKRYPLIEAAICSHKEEEVRSIFAG